jgi:hypothetical protein
MLCAGMPMPIYTLFEARLYHLCKENFEEHLKNPLQTERPECRCQAMPFSQLKFRKTLKKSVVNENGLNAGASYVIFANKNFEEHFNNPLANSTVWRSSVAQFLFPD